MSLIAAANAHNGSWDTNPIYLAAANHQIVPGQSDAYDYTRTERYTQYDYTTFIAGQALWRDNNLPDILKMIRPTTSWKEWETSHFPAIERNSQGQIQLESWPGQGRTGRPRRHFAVLPDQIYSCEKGWVIEAWMRLDPTMRRDDILMRMRHPDEDLMFKRMNKRRYTARTSLDLLTWQNLPPTDPAHLKNESILASFSKYQIAANSIVARPDSLQRAIDVVTAALESMPTLPPLDNKPTEKIGDPREGTIAKRRLQSARDAQPSAQPT